MGIPVLDTVIGESPEYYATGTTTKSFTYMPEKKIRGIIVVPIVAGGNAVAQTAPPKVGEAGTVSIGSSANSGAPTMQAQGYRLDLGSSQAGPFTISVNKNTAVRTRYLVLGIRSKSALTFSASKAVSTGASETGETVATIPALTVPAGGCLAFAAISGGANKPIAQSDTKLLDKKETETESWSLQKAEPASGTQSFTFTYPSASRFAAIAYYVEGEPPGAEEVEVSTITRGYAIDAKGRVAAAQPVGTTGTEFGNEWEQNGFVRDKKYRIVMITSTAGARVRNGFLRGPEERIVVTTNATGATVTQGFLRAPNYALVVSETETPVIRNGWPRDTNYALAAIGF